MSTYQGASTEAIQQHYNSGNEFYRLWLDPSMTYSAALWREGDDLAGAQRRKLDFHIRQAGVEKNHRVLDIGCGWGSLLRRLAEHGVEHAVGLSLSQNQVESIAVSKQARIEARLENWTDHDPQAPYDGIISIGAFEHFAACRLVEVKKIAAYRAFFERCHAWLKPGARLSLQTIVYENAGADDINEFLSQDIFPESELPRLAEILKACERLFEVVSLRNDRKHYERTLGAWLKNLRARREQATALAGGAQQTATYEKYFGLCMIGFHSGALNLSRITLQRIDKPRL